MPFFSKLLQGLRSTERLDICVISDVGKLRENNEDNFIVNGIINSEKALHAEIHDIKSANWKLLGVFDGMGGGEKGEEAAWILAEELQKRYRSEKKKPSQNDIDLIIRQAFLDANNRIVALQEAHTVIGTTGSVIVCCNNVIKVYHLGDSRIYCVHNGELIRLTRDQTLAQMKIDIGIYEPNDPKAQIEQHMLTEYVGKDTTKKNLRPLETSWLKLEKGDALLICSDGLYDMCSDEVILSILKNSQDAKESACSLLNAALKNGGTDNITCVAAYCR